MTNCLVGGIDGGEREKRRSECERDCERARGVREKRESVLAGMGGRERKRAKEREVRNAGHQADSDVITGDTRSVSHQTCIVIRT